MAVMGKAYVITKNFEGAEARFGEAREIASGSNDWETIVKIEREFINLYLVQENINAAKEVERKLKSLQEVVG